jgi:tRNA A-37 threonylcarbamoyl transferase component Bud32/tetratricopeptide (TPR) repeat protein
MSPAPSRWDRLQQIFFEAGDLADGARAAYLDRACGGDHALRAEVEELLALDTGGVSAVALGAVQSAARAVSTHQEHGWVGRRVGAWEITGVLGRGGMGAVYEVERADGAYRQRAAMKLMRREWSAADGERRFAEERQILAQLEHPNIARLLDGGSTSEGLPFLVMEVVDGLPIHRYAESARLGVEARLRLAVTVASAVHAAHRKLVIHRDLKPANILVTVDGVVKLLDFGIARLAESAAEDPGELLFSPAFASPEQLNGEAVSTASDIYSLGAILFELLTGQPPRPGGGVSLAELRAAAARPIPQPSAVAPALPKRLRADLDCIVARATHADPAMRYESAERFAADLERCVAGRPVMAHPGGYAYRSRKYLRRHLASAALVTCAVIGLVGTTVNSVVQARRAERRFGEVRHLANIFLFDVHDGIRDLQGSTKAREAIVRTALQYLESLAQGRSDRGLALEVAAAYDRVGAIQYLAGAASLGKPAEARKSYRRAVEIRGEWLRREPGNAALHQQQAESYLNLAGAENGLIGLDLVTAAYTSGLEHGELARRLSNPPSPKVLDTLAKLYRSRGVLRARTGDLKGSSENYRAALAMHEELARRGSDPDLIQNAAESRGRLALSLYIDGRQQEARIEFRATTAKLEALSAAHPDNRRYLRALQASHMTHGAVLTNRMLAIADPKEAVELFRRALELAVRLAKDAADRNAARDLAVAHCQLGFAIGTTNPPAAAAEAETGMGMLRRIMAGAPEDRGLQQTILAYQPSYAVMLARMGRAGALAEARQAVAMAETLGKGDPTALQALRRKLTVAKGLANVQFLLGSFPAVRAAIEPVRGVLEQGELPAISLTLLDERISVYGLLARAAARAGDASEAARWNAKFEDAVGEFERRGLGGPMPEEERGRVRLELKRAGVK